MNSRKVIETEALIIGGGATGAGVMRDLALRGIRCLLIDRRDLCAGASGGNHGLLHSGGRYVSNDSHAARECREESDILKRLASHCVEQTGSLFVATNDDDGGFISRFPGLCSEVGISCESISASEAQEMEPNLTRDLQQVYLLPDATVDPFRLVLDNVADAVRNDGVYRSHTEVVSFETSNGCITAVVCRDNQTGDLLEIRAQHYVNAGGAWAMEIAKLGGCRDINLHYSKGTLLISHDRLANRVIHRLRPPSDGDILVPGGTVSVLGTTSVHVDSLADLRPTVEEVDKNIYEGSKMVPDLIKARYIRAFAGVRPLLQSAPGEDDRAMTRGFALFDHENELTNLVTITGGKLTTYRLMAEKAADLVAKRLGNDQRCKTRDLELINSESSKWTEPGASPRYWYKADNPEDMILCECEMVPQSAVDEIVRSSPESESKMTLEAIALRSRAGKGPCQGSFCSIRIASYLYDCGYYDDESGLRHMKEFLNERFKGLRSITWGQQAAQMELAEALHCGLMGLDRIETNQDSDESE